MFEKYIFAIVLSLFLSCNTQTLDTEPDDSLTAKWFYYSYAMDQNAYRRDGTEIQPLECDIKINHILRLNADTTKFYFTLFNKDTQNIVYLKPLALQGITVVKNKLYIPIYHSVVFEIEDDSSVLKEMQIQNMLLLSKVLGSGGNITSWLKKEAQSRKRASENYQNAYVTLEDDFQITPCGTLAITNAIKFKDVITDSSMIGTIRCPDSYGEGFFKQGRKYEIKYTNINVADSIKDYSLRNPYGHHNFPTYFVTDIKIAK